MFLNKKMGGEVESCILSSSYPWRRWENVLQVNERWCGQGLDQLVLSPYQEPLIPPTNSSPCFHLPGAQSLSTHKAGSEGQGRWSVWSHLSGGEARIQNQDACCSSLHQRKSLFSLSLKKRHWVYKVVTREKFFPPFPFLSFCLLTYYSSCLHSPQS